MVSTADKNWNAGVFIDIDGVVLQGGKPFEWSKDAINALWDNKIPFVFVTNGTYSSVDLVNNLRKIFGLPFTNDHVIVAPSPCAGLTEFHSKRVLVCCQNDSIALIKELGFTDYLTVDQLADIFPDLDYIDHDRREQLKNQPISGDVLKAQREFRPIELILLLGEPVRWERSLQLLIDVLMTNGDPRQKFKFVPELHLPIIACNKDLTFKGAAALPRFGHGAFLASLEALYMKITKNELTYEEIMGKPYLIQYEYAATQIQKLSPNGKEINKFYIIGDNPDVDIKGANMYREHLEGSQPRKSSRRPSCKQSLAIESSIFNPHLANQPVESILVCTGVYNPQNDLLYHVRKLIGRQNMPPSITSPSDPNNNLVCADDSKMSASTIELTPFENDDRSIRRNKSFNSFNDSKDFDPDELSGFELSVAMARKNSFISYFDDHYNVPDHIFDNFMASVNYILDSIGVR